MASSGRWEVPHGRIKIEDDPRKDGAKDEKHGSRSIGQLDHNMLHMVHIHGCTVTLGFTPNFWLTYLILFYLFSPFSLNFKGTCYLSWLVLISAIWIASRLVRGVSFPLYCL